MKINYAKRKRVISQKLKTLLMLNIKKLTLAMFSLSKKFIAKLLLLKLLKISSNSVKLHPSQISMT